MTLEIVTIESSSNASILKKPAKTVQFPLSNSIKSLIEAMKVKLIEIDGAGLAASQVGHHVKIIVFHVTPDALKIRKSATEVIPLTVFINPSYAPIEKEGKFADWEGCFSVESIRGKPLRYQAIQYEAFTPEGEHVKEEARGYLARLLQHEIDHTNGILITDVLTPECVQGPVQEMMMLRQKEIENRLHKK